MNNSFMNKLAEGIVNRRRLIAIVFAVIVVFSVFAIGWTEIVEDFTLYLPEDAEARMGLDVMNEFVTYGSAQILIKNISYENAEFVVQKLETVPGVAMLSFDSSENHYKDNNALIDISMATETADPASKETIDALKDVLDRYGFNYYCSTEIGESLVDLLFSQMGSVLIFCVIVVLAVLVFTSDSYGEIPVILITLVAAGIINMGTAFLMGPISFISDSVAIVLQLALSIDYSIILCNRYKKEHETLCVDEALVKAVSASVPEISASSLTTVSGLLAMTFMHFKLGFDLGINLVKAIIISMLSVFLLMPVLIRAFSGLMDRTRHRSFIPKIDFLGKFAHATRFIIPIILLPIVVFAAIRTLNCTYAYTEEIIPASKGTPYEMARSEINNTFGAENVIALIIPNGDYQSEKAVAEELESCIEVKRVFSLATVEAMDGTCLGDTITYADIMTLANVDDTTARALMAYYAADNGDQQKAAENLDGYSAPLVDVFLFLNKMLQSENLEVEVSQEQRDMVADLYSQLSLAKDQLQSNSHSRLLIYLNTPLQGDDTFSIISRARVIAEQYYSSDDIYLTGTSVSAKDFADTFSTDTTIVSAVSIILVMIVLLFTFKSFVMPVLLILVIQGSIWINFAIPTLSGTPVFFMCYLVVSAIQMGANIDYAIVVSNRYREKRAELAPREAAVEALNFAFPTVLTSGLMMIFAGLLVGGGVTERVISGIGHYVGIGTIVSVILIMLCLPQLLILGDKVVAATTIRVGNVPVRRRTQVRTRQIVSFVLLAASVFAIFAGVSSNGNRDDYVAETKGTIANVLLTVDTLQEISDRLKEQTEDAEELKAGFTEQLLTDEIGQEALDDGQAQYDEGYEEYAAGLAQYEEGALQLAEGKEEYAAALAQLQAGKAEYEKGLAAYEAAKKKYAIGKQQYEDGQVAYEQGKAALAQAEKDIAAGQAEYDKGLSSYNTAKSLLDSVTPAYTAAKSAADSYNNTKARWQQAVASGDLVTATLLAAELRVTEGAGNALNAAAKQYENAKAQVDAAKAELDAGEKKLADGKAKYAAGQKKLANSEVQLADGKKQLDAGSKQLKDAEKQLADAKAQIEDGERQLAAVKQQLDEGDRQLAAAQKELESGKSQLDDAKAQIDDGRKQLADNRDSLNASLAALDDYASEEDKLNDGIELLASLPGIRRIIGPDSTPDETLTAVRDYYQGELSDLESMNERGRILSLALIIAGALGIAACFLGALRIGVKLPRLLSFLAFFIALLCVIFWIKFCPALTFLFTLAAIILSAAAVVYTEVSKT